MGGLTRSEPDHAMESNAEQKSRRVVRLRHINLILGLFAALLAVILVWFAVIKRPIYEAILVSFLILLTVGGKWGNVWKYVYSGLSIL